MEPFLINTSSVVSFGTRLTAAKQCLSILLMLTLKRILTTQNHNWMSMGNQFQ